jgi:hypothetical protein
MEKIMKRILLLSLLVPILSHTMQQEVEPKKEILAAVQEPTPFRRFLKTWMAFGRMHLECTVRKHTENPNDFYDFYTKPLEYQSKPDTYLHEDHRVGSKMTALIQEAGLEHGIPADAYNIRQSWGSPGSIPFPMISWGELTIYNPSSRSTTFEDFYSVEEQKAIFKHEFEHTNFDPSLDKKNEELAFGSKSITERQGIEFLQFLEHKTDARSIIHSPNALDANKNLLSAFQKINSTLTQLRREEPENKNHLRMQQITSERIGFLQFLYNNLQKEHDHLKDLPFA